MAFKPFDFFRITTRRGRLMMAGLVLVAMFSFILLGVLPNPGGEGSAIGNWFRRVFGTEERVFTVDGTSYGQAKAADLVFTRRDCFAFLEEYQKETYARLSKKYSTTATGSEQEHLKKEAEEKFNETRLTRTFRVVQERTFWVYFRAHTDPNAAAREALEFAYYLKRADELGIVFPRHRVMDDLRKFGANLIAESDLPAVLKARKIHRSVDSIIEALGQEIRVLMARTAIEGTERGPSLSVQPTPRDLWDAWVHLRTQSHVAILDFRAEDYVQDVPAPDEKTLRQFFDTWKGNLPDPTRPEPGLKTPKLFQLECFYIDITPSSGGARSYYQQQVDKRYLVQMLTSSAPPYLVGTRKLRLGPATIHVPVWRSYEFAIDAYRRYLNDATRPDSAVVQTPEMWFQVGERMPDGTFYRLPEGMKLAADQDSVALEELNQAWVAAQAFLTGGGMAGLPLADPLILGHLPTVPLFQRTVSDQPNPILLQLSNALAAPALSPVDAVTVSLLYGAQGYSQIPAVPLAAVWAPALDAANEDLLREALADDLKKLHHNLRLYSQQYDYWQRKKKAARSSRPAAPVPEQPPLFRDQDQKTDVFGLLVEQGPVALAQTQGLIRETPIDDYLKDWAETRNVEFITKEKYGKPRAKDDLLAGETDPRPLNTLLKPLFRELDEKFRKTPLGTTVENWQDPEADFEKALLDALVGENLARSLSPEPHSPQGGISRSEFKLYQPRESMPLLVRRTYGDIQRDRQDIASFLLASVKPNRIAVYWKSAEIDERIPEFTEAGVAERAERAWRLLNSRDAARKAAEKFIEQSSGASPEAGILRDVAEFKAKHPNRVWDEKPISRYEDRGGPTAGSGFYSEFKPPTFFHHPPDDVIERIMSQLTKPGDAIVVENKPKNRYYVVVLQARIEPDLRSFDDLLIGSTRKPFVGTHSFSSWVLERKSQQYAKEWGEFLAKKLGFDPDSRLGEYFQQMVRGALRP